MRVLEESRPDGWRPFAVDPRSDATADPTRILALEVRSDAGGAWQPEDYFGGFVRIVDYPDGVSVDRMMVRVTQDGWPCWARQDPRAVFFDMRDNSDLVDSDTGHVLVGLPDFRHGPSHSDDAYGNWVALPKAG